MVLMGVTANRVGGCGSIIACIHIDHAWGSAPAQAQANGSGAWAVPGPAEPCCAQPLVHV
jgi:hypothetical protein